MEKFKLQSICKNIGRGVNVLEDTTEDKISYYEVKISNFIGNDISIDENDINNNGKYSQIANKQLEKGDILIPLRRGTASGNKIAIYNLDMDIPVIVSHHIFVIRPKQNIVNSFYLLFYFLNISEEMNSNELNIMKKSGLVAINIKYLKDLDIPLPSLEEQVRAEEYFNVSQQMYTFSNELKTFHKTYYENVVNTSDTASLDNNTSRLKDILSSATDVFKDINSSISK